MANPNEPRPCGCIPEGKLCPQCYAVVSREDHERAMRDWLRSFGTQPDPNAPARKWRLAVRFERV